MSDWFKEQQDRTERIEKAWKTQSLSASEDLDNILKAKSGVYANTPENRKKGRVGIPYGRGNIGSEGVVKVEEKEKNTRSSARKWWSSLSMNEQDKFRKEHPFFGKMDKDYFYAHKTSVEQVYEHYKKTHKKDVKKLESKVTMSNLDWGKTTAERNSNLDKYNSLKSNEEKEKFKKELKKSIKKSESIDIIFKAFEEGKISEDILEKAWSVDLQKKNPGSAWKTVNGAKILVGKGGEVLASNKELKSKLEGKKGINISDFKRRSIEGESGLLDGLLMNDVGNVLKIYEKKPKNENIDLYNKIKGIARNEKLKSGKQVDFVNYNELKELLKNTKEAGKSTEKKENKKEYKFKNITTTRLDEIDASLQRAGVDSTPDFNSMTINIKESDKAKADKVLSSYKGDMKSEEKKEIKGLSKKDEKAFDDFLKREKVGYATALKNPGRMNELVDKFKKEQSSKKEEKETKQVDKAPTLDTFKEIAKTAKDADDFISKVREIKNVPTEVAKEFQDKYGKGKSIKEASLAFINDVKGKGTSEKKEIEKPKKESTVISNKISKDLDSFAKQKLDNEKTETISKLANLASKIDEKYLSTKTKNKLNKLVDDIYVKGYFGDHQKNIAVVDKIYRAKDIKESLSALKTLNNRLAKEDSFALEEDMVDKIQSVLVEAAKEQLNKKTTEKLNYKLFKALIDELDK
jgi:hypothetical protein